MSAAMYAPTTMTTMAAPTTMTTMVAPTTMTTMAAPVTYAVAPTYAAAPAMEYASVMAAPVTYAQAPTVQYAQQYSAPTTMTYAAPAAYEYVTQAPQVEYITQAPQVTYAAPMTTTTASYVAAPMMQQAIVAAPAPVAPTSLCIGIPTPAQIQTQKAGYAAALDKQLTEAMATVTKETEIEKQMVKFNMEKNIALFTMQAEEMYVEQCALLDEQVAFQQLELKKALVERNLQLSAQAAGLTMDYEMKAVQSELAMKQYQFQVEYMGAETKLEQEYMKQVQIANTGTAYAAPATVA